jgi:DNA-binding NarL/FixJ family response regulator
MEPSEAAGKSVGEGIISVVIADDDEMFGAALEEVIAAAPQLRLVGMAEDAAGAIALTERHHPDVAVLDVRMPGGGVEAAREISTRSPRTTIIGLSAYDDRDTVTSMAGAGARTHLVKAQVTGNDVVAAIRQAAGRG